MGKLKRSHRTLWITQKVPHSLSKMSKPPKLISFYSDTTAMLHIIDCLVSSPLFQKMHLKCVVYHYERGFSELIDFCDIAAPKYYVIKDFNHLQNLKFYFL